MIICGALHRHGKVQKYSIAYLTFKVESEYNEFKTEYNEYQFIDEKGNFTYSYILF